MVDLQPDLFAEASAPVPPPSFPAPVGTRKDRESHAKAQPFEYEAHPKSRQVASAEKAANIISAFSKGQRVTVNGRELLFHRACPDVRLAALDAGIGGPVFFHGADEVVTLHAELTDGALPVSSQSVLIASQSIPIGTQSAAPAGSPIETKDARERLKAAQQELDCVAKAAGLNGPEYMAQLTVMAQALREVRR